MSSAWLLPEHIADVLPSEAKRIEGLRRALTDEASAYGYELVMPPLVEHLDSLLSGTGRMLGLQTFKLVDQLSGRTLGLRADTTPQVARIDAHLLNRKGVVRLAYCGPVVHTRPSGPWSTREPLQFGAEIYGHAGLEADLEVIELAIDGLRQAGIRDLVLDLGDARIAAALMSQAGLEGADRSAVAQALAAKDAAELQAALRVLGAPQGPAAAAVQGLLALLNLYGPVDVLDRAASALPGQVHRDGQTKAHAQAQAQAQTPGLEDVTQALADLRWICSHVAHTHPDVRLGVDLADLGGQDYYSGVRFSLMAAGSVQALASGGRYDHVGRVFGRQRPAVGFSLDIKGLAQALAQSGGAPLPRPAIRAPWSEDAGLRAAVRELRARGETVVCILPGHEDEAQEFACDRELAFMAGRWVLQAL